MYVIFLEYGKNKYHFLYYQMIMITERPTILTVIYAILGMVIVFIGGFILGSL